MYEKPRKNRNYKLTNRHKKNFPIREVFLVRVIGLEPTRLAAPDPKSGMSTNFTISAKSFANIIISSEIKNLIQQFVKKY